jgi:hypothetical protein
MDNLRRGGAHTRVQSQRERHEVRPSNSTREVKPGLATCEQNIVKVEWSGNNRVAYRGDWQGGAITYNDG